MANQGRTYLKNKWVSGYKPNQSDYSEFFDSFYNITDDNIGYTTNIIYVDDTLGDDGTAQKGYRSKPYASIDTATTNALPGDIVFVERGTYTMFNAFKPDVIYYLGYSTINAYYEIADYSYGAGIYKIYGHADINCTTLISTLTNSSIYLECNSISYYTNLISGNLINCNITIVTKLYQGVSGGAFGGYFDSLTDLTTLTVTADEYVLPRGFIGWFNSGSLTINLYGKKMTHSGPDGFASLAWILGDATTMNFYVEDITITNSVATNSFFPWYGILNVYSKVYCDSYTSIIMADGGVTTFYQDINATDGIVYVRGASGKVILKGDFNSDRQNTCVTVVGTLVVNGTIKSTDTTTTNTTISIGSAASVVLNNAKIIADVSKFSIQASSGTPLVKVFGSCYSIGTASSITTAPEVITQYSGLV